MIFIIRFCSEETEEEEEEEEYYSLLIVNLWELFSWLSVCDGERMIWKEGIDINLLMIAAIFGVTGKTFVLLLCFFDKMVECNNEINHCSYTPLFVFDQSGSTYICF